MINTKHYASVAELLSASPSPANKCRADQHWEGLYEWHGVTSKEEALKVLSGGWAEGVRRAKSCLASLDLPKIQSIRRKPTWKDAGDDLSLDRLYSGQMDAWRSTERRSCPPGLIPCHRIMVCINGERELHPSLFFWRGAVAAVLADALEESGRACEIVAYSHVTNLQEGRPQDQTVTTVLLKGADEPLDLSRVVAMSAHAAALRVGFFRSYYTWPLKLSKGLGTVYDVDPPSRADEPSIVIRGIYSEGAAKDFLKRVASGFGE